MEPIPQVESLARRFAAAGWDNPRRMAEELLAHVLGCKPMEIYARPEPRRPETIPRLDALARRIEDGEPLQYLVGHVDFFGLEIRCDRRALIPRPETECLVAEVLDSAVWNRKPATVADIGTGSGCIILALAHERPGHRFIAIDRSPAALGLARENARRHGLEKRVEWVHGSLLEPVSPGSCDAMVANLPYVSDTDWERLPRFVREYEPRTALEGGPAGTELIEALARQARGALVPGGLLFLEFGCGQAGAVSRMLEALGYEEIRIKRDLAGHDRIATATRPA